MEQIITFGELASFIDSEEVRNQIGVSGEDKVEVKISNRTMTVRSLNAEERAAKIAALTREIFDERREAYLELAKGPQ
ncbi:MAG: hypothetical protein ACKVZH_05250 [Blastocatellia bacterium]